MEFKRISRENGQWNTLWQQWDKECTKYGETISDYATSALSTLKPLAEDPQITSAGVYGLIDKDEIVAVCQLNVTGLPGYTGPVVRLRHLVLAPKFDFDDSTTIQEYINVLSSVFAGTINLAHSEMKADHAKLHFRSPADKEFFKNIEQSLKSNSVFSHVALKGSWLYVSIK
ncbi:hypothetical protein K3X41_04390 [Aliiroseovarius crassostreae]|uniref:hypothetical protein n=1 Tax=Aliiroseovarius crassostreae TaxID=154981 RepID=UPI0022053639|nr:hypothetical protein [Aliiroseovarius crassostreae]UWQ11932.1 hypothetical protein K3X41_04390 [Aliiroseovarius crassostreae]